MTNLGTRELVAWLREAVFDGTGTKLAHPDYFRTLFDRVDDLLAQRDDLLAALGKLARSATRGERCGSCDAAIGLHGDLLYFHLPGCAVINARKAITRATGAKAEPSSTPDSGPQIIDLGAALKRSVEQTQAKPSEGGSAGEGQA